jgi:O-acetylserine/cysteine efflux transporter
MNRKAWTLALLVILAWGCNFVFIRWGLDELPPMLLGALRFICVAFPAILFVRRPALPFRWLFAYGITISFGQFALLFSAMHLGMPAGIASLVLQAQAIFTLVFALLFLGERWQPQQLWALLIAGAGLGVLASQADPTTMTLAGFGLTLAAAASWGAGNIINRHIGSHGSIDLVSLVIWGALIPPLPFMLMSYFMEGPELIMASLAGMGIKSLVSLTYLALVATIFGYSTWGWLLRHHPASHIAPLTLLVPIVGLLCAWLILDESLSAVQAVGIVLVMLGLLVNSFGQRWLQQFKRALA